MGPAAGGAGGISRHPAAGAAEDIEVVVGRTALLFDEFGDLRFQRFVDVWKDVKFGLVFCGRQTFRETFELTEDLFELAKLMAFGGGSGGTTASRSAAAMYLLYSLYFKQPTRPKAKIRLKLSEFKQLAEFIDSCRKDEHWDVAYVWVKLLADGAFWFSLEDRPLGLETTFLNELRPQVGLPVNSLQSPATFSTGGGGGDDGGVGPTVPFRSVFEGHRFKDLMGSLTQIHRHYAGMKRALESQLGGHCGERPPPTAAYREMDLPEALNAVMADIRPPKKRPRRSSSSEAAGAQQQHSVPVEGEPSRSRITEGNLLKKADGSTIGDRRMKLRAKFFGSQASTAKDKDVAAFVTRGQLD